jgi:hypothetical protein
MLFFCQKGWTWRTALVLLKLHRPGAACLCNGKPAPALDPKLVLYNAEGLPAPPFRRTVEPIET